MTDIVVSPSVQTSVEVSPDVVMSLLSPPPQAPTINVSSSGDVIVQAVVSPPTAITAIESAPVVVTVEQSLQSLVVQTPAVQGPMGPPGPEGGQPTFIAESVLSGHRVVKITNTGQLGYADASVATDAFTIVGLTTQSYVVGQTATVQGSGTITHAGWSWIVGQPILVGLNGYPTQSIPPSAVFVKQIGIAITTNTIVLNLSSPAVNI